MRTRLVTVAASLAALAISACTGTAPCTNASCTRGEGESGGEGEGSSAGEGEGEGEGAIDEQCTSTDQLALFTQKVEPLVSGSLPTTCNQCHLQGVDLSMYVQDTPCETMACFVAQGEVTFADPTASPILARILNSNPASNLIDQVVIQAEHDGFLEWIQWNAQCFDAVCGTIADPCNSGTGQPPPPDVLTPLGGCNEDTLVASFDAKVFSWRGRCISCHATYGANTDQVGVDAPDWIFGAQEAPVGVDDARFTMFSVIGRQLIDRANPVQSLLLLKPLNNPAGFHGGGTKFQNTDEQTYQDFLSWINEYASCFPPVSAGEGEGEGEGGVDPGPQAPVVSINHPGQNDGPRASGVAIPWIGVANDPQEGALSGASLVWTSSLLSTPFGTGTNFSAVLPDGTNLVTLTATDADGNTGTATVTVVVQ